MRRFCFIFILFLNYLCVTRLFAQDMPEEKSVCTDIQESQKLILQQDSIVRNCLIDSVTVYSDYSIAILQVHDSTSPKRFTVVAQLTQFGTIDVSKMVGQTHKLFLRKVPPFKKEDNARVITYVGIATGENGPLYINADEITSGAIYYLHKFADISADSSIHPDQIILHSLEDMYYAAVDAFLTIGGKHHLIAKDVPIYVSSEHFYTPFRMFIKKRELPEGMEFCDDSDLKKKITRKHPFVYCWYFGTQVNDDTITIWAWTPYFKKKRSTFARIILYLLLGCFSISEWWLGSSKCKCKPNIAHYFKSNAAI